MNLSFDDERGCVLVTDEKGRRVRFYDERDLNMFTGACDPRIRFEMVCEETFYYADSLGYERYWHNGDKVEPSDRVKITTLIYDNLYYIENFLEKHKEKCE